jgi:hypothetical protein
MVCVINFTLNCATKLIHITLHHTDILKIKKVKVCNTYNRSYAKKKLYFKCIYSKIQINANAATE